MKIMTVVNNELCIYFSESYSTDSGGGVDMSFYFAMTKFRPADEQIKIICLGISQDKKIRINKKYNQFKENTINSWIEARDYSQDPDHEYTNYFDFYEYLNTEVLK